MVRSRKRIFCIGVLLLLFILVCFVNANQDSGDESADFYWDREKSHFVDYSISGDTIQFRYALCFVNNNDDGYDFILSHLIASFRKRELRGWLKYEKCYHGLLEDGSSEIIIKNGETVEIIYTFAGEYLGGPVNEDLSMPDIVMGLDIQ